MAIATLRKPNNDALERIRYALWKQADLKFTAFEKPFLNALRRSILPLQEETDTNIKNIIPKMEMLRPKESRFVEKADSLDDQITGILFGFDDETKKAFVQQMKGTYEEIYKSFGDDVIANLGVEVGFNVPQKFITRYIGNTFAPQVALPLRNAVKIQMKKAFLAGETVQQIQRKVKTIFEGTYRAENFRALRIARTEIVRAGNAATWEANKQSGVVKDVMWLSARDGNVRDTHVKADGQVIKLGKRFRVGGSDLRFPLDPSGPAKEIVNCRCFTISTPALFGRRGIASPVGSLPPVSGKPDVSVKPRPEFKPVKVSGVEEMKGLKTGIKSEDLTNSEFRSLRFYQDNGYKSINLSLRDNELFLERLRFSEETLDEILDDVRNIKRVMGRSVVDEDLVAFRGMRRVADKFGVESLEDSIGLIIEDKGFASFSLNEKRGIDFSKGGNPSVNAVIELRVPKGTNAVNMPKALPNRAGVEMELLMDSGLKFRIIDVQLNSIRVSEFFEEKISKIIAEVVL